MNNRIENRGNAQADGSGILVAVAMDISMKDYAKGRVFNVDQKALQTSLMQGGLSEEDCLK